MFRNRETQTDKYLKRCSTLTSRHEFSSRRRKLGTSFRSLIVHKNFMASLSPGHCPACTDRFDFLFPPRGAFHTHRLPLAWSVSRGELSQRLKVTSCYVRQIVNVDEWRTHLIAESFSIAESWSNACFRADVHRSFVQPVSSRVKWLGDVTTRNFREVTLSSKSEKLSFYAEFFIQILKLISKIVTKIEAIENE